MLVPRSCRFIVVLSAFASQQRVVVLLWASQHENARIMITLTKQLSNMTNNTVWEVCILMDGTVNVT